MLMIVKDNQPTLRADIALVFADSAASDFIEDRSITTDKGHGRLEVRTLETSTALNDYLDWPGLKQVFRLHRKVTFL
ncbi:MAG: ISAs1 family transposase, partial [Thermoproteota archaeon]